jgi:hypothetical protein
LVNGDIFTTKIYFNAAILDGFPSVQEFFQQICPWNCTMNRKKATKTSPLYSLPLFGSHLDPIQHFLDLFPFSRCLLPNHFLASAHFDSIVLYNAKSIITQMVKLIKDNFLKTNQMVLGMKNC